MHKYVEREHGKRRLQQAHKCAVREEERRKMVDVHHLGAEKSGAAKARPEARLWLRDYLGRQAGGRSSERVTGNE